MLPFRKGLFDDAGVDMNSDANIVTVFGRGGPHWQEYRSTVYERLVEAVGDAAPKTAEFQGWFLEELAAIRKDLETPGSDLWWLVQKRGNPFP